MFFFVCCPRVPATCKDQRRSNLDDRCPFCDDLLYTICICVAIAYRPRLLLPTPDRKQRLQARTRTRSLRPPYPYSRFLVHLSFPKPENVADLHSDTRCRIMTSILRVFVHVSCHLNSILVTLTIIQLQLQWRMPMLSEYLEIAVRYYP